VQSENATAVQSNLLHRIASGDGAAVRECIDRFGGLVWSLARRLALSDAEAEDAVQEIFVEIWNNAYRYDPGVASETAFIAMIARRRLIDRRRKLNRQPDRGVLPDDGLGPSVRQQADRSEIGEEAVRAARAVEQLSPEQQRVLRLSIYQGLSHEEIARSTGLPLGTVKTHARRGLIRVRELLNVNPADPADTARAREAQNGEGAA
jgi:RNA polymerase sigma-70 factor (ECF subfamily)